MSEIWIELLVFVVIGGLVGLFAPHWFIFIFIGVCVGIAVYGYLDKRKE